MTQFRISLPAQAPDLQKLEQALQNVDPSVLVDIEPFTRVLRISTQLDERGLLPALHAQGVEVHLIGGADVAAELDAKRAIDQGTRLAATL